MTPVEVSTPSFTPDEVLAANLLVTILESEIGIERDTAAFLFVVRGMGLMKAMKSLVRKLRW